MKKAFHSRATGSAGLPRQLGAAILCAVLGLVGSAPGQEVSGTVDPLPTAPVPNASGPFGLANRNFSDQTIIQSEEAYFTEKDGTIAYSNSRTRIEYNQFVLEADRMVVDMVSEDIQAEGNVVFTGSDQFIRAERGRFNLGKAEGVAYGMNGQVEDIYFQVKWDEEGRGPAFLQINEQQSLFRGAAFTTNSFPVPMYYIRAKEIIFVRKERVFFREAVLFVRGVPVLWLPVYSRNIKEGSPWFNQFGYADSVGAYFRLGYRYIHQVKTPRFQDPTKYETRTHGLVDVYGDVFTQRGEGAGAQYRYKFDYGRHIGYLQVYGLRDRKRDVVGDNDETDRWVYRHKHNSLLTDSLMFQLDVDRASDPDIYVDVLDRFAPDLSFERGRLFDQSTTMAVTYRTRNEIARLGTDTTDRLGRNRYTDYSEPGEDDLDYDPDPNFSSSRDEEGIPSERYGEVSERVRARYSTRLLNLGGAPLYYRFEANAFRANDSGFNTQDAEDDAWVDGAEARGELTNRIRLGARTTWTNSVGVGGAVYERESDELIPQSRFAAGALQPDGTRRIDGIRFRDTRTVLLGTSPTEISTEETESFYLFADYTSRLNHRFTDFLDGYIEYKVRKGTEDGLGEFYERIGRPEAKTDLHDFYTDQHLITSGLNYYLRYPNLTTSVIAGHNLQDRANIFPYEVTRFAGFNTGYRNPSQEFLLDFGATYEERQIRDRLDPNEFEQASIGPYVRASYYPRHARYWAQLTVSSDIKLREDPVVRPERERARYDENLDEINIGPVVGRRFGPKYRVQVGGDYTTRYDTWNRFGVVLIRDLHDAELGLQVGVRNNSFEARREQDDPNAREYELELRGSVQFKINREQPGLGTRSITTLADLKRQGYYVR